MILDANTPAIRRHGSWHALGVESPLATIVTAYDPAAFSAFAFTAIDMIVKPFGGRTLWDCAGFGQIKNCSFSDRTAGC